MHQENIRTRSEILMASAFSSVISTLITNPIEVAKLNLQYFPLACPQYPHPNYQQLSNCQCSRFSLAGAAKSLKMAIPQVLFSNIIFMQIYEKVREYAVNTLQFGSISSTFLASLTGRFIVTSANVPFQSIRIKLSNEVKTSTFFKNFHGYKVTLARDLLYSLTFWSSLQAYRNYISGGLQYREVVQNVSLGWQYIIKTNFVPGFMVGGIVSILTTPFDTLKTRVQSKGVIKYSIWKEIMQIYKVERLMGLFSGVQYRVIKNGTHGALYLIIYEWFLNKIKAKEFNALQ